MPFTQCVVPECFNSGNHIIPQNKERRNAWINAIKRGESRFKAWVPPSKFSYICKDHFVDDDYYVPEAYHGKVPLQRRLKKTAVPTKFNSTKNETATPSVESRKDRIKRRRLFQDKTNYVEREMKNEVAADFGECNTPTMDEICVGAYEVLSEELCTSEIRSDVHESQQEGSEGTYHSISQSSETQTPKQAMYSVENFRKDDAGLHFYTGLENIMKFYFVLSTLGPAAYCLNYAYHNIINLNVPDQFFLVLIKLRRHTTNFELSRMFNISETVVSNVIFTWIYFMYHQWKEVNIWPPQELVRYFSPSGFKCNYPKTRVIIDGTECPIKKPKNPKSQQATFSTYKNKNTVKVLVGATPGGLVSFVSNAYAGSTSDRQIVERSNLVQLCDPKDSIMADKGFNVQDIFAPSDVTINIPTFFRKKNRMTGDVVIRDRKIASKRVHIERLIGLAKTYKILTEPMSATETNMSSEIIFVCFMLCNFRKCIVDKHA